MAINIIDFRITTMVEHLCTNYGTRIAEIDDKIYYNFPQIETLSYEKVEKELRVANFGFRAKYIQQAAEYITKNGNNNWICNLQNMSYVEAKEELMKLPGVGAKVICSIGFYFDKYAYITIITIGLTIDVFFLLIYP